MKNQKKKKKQRASMSFLTSLGLSANNLRTKKGRTILTAFAGSIGIIGIALILALSSGVNDYIQSLEEDTMAEYPLQITSSEFDISSLLSSVSPGSMPGGLGVSGDEDAEISVTKVITTMFAQLSSNDLASLKKYIESGESDIMDYVKAIEYIYNVDPLIYMTDGDGYRQVNPDTSMRNSGNMLSMLSGGTSSFYAMPENVDLYRNQYELKAGRWPESYNECILVLTSSGSISDYMLYTLGLRDYSELEAMIEQYNNGEDVEEIDDIGSYSYEDVLGITYKVINSADLYAYDDEYDVWVDKSDNEEYMQELVENGEELTIVGVVQPLEDAITANLSSGINYPMSLVYHMSDLAAGSDAVLAQMEDPDTNIFTGEPFGEDSDFDLGSMLSIDEDALKDAFDMEDAFPDFEFDTSSLDFEFDEDSFDLDMDFDMSDFEFDLDLSDMDMEFDLSDMDLDFSVMDLSGMDLDLSGMDFSFDLSDLNFDLSGMQVEMPDMDMSSMMSDVVNVDLEVLQELSSNILSDFTDSEIYQNFAAYLMDGGKRVIPEILNEEGCLEITVNSEGLEAAVTDAVKQYEAEQNDNSEENAPEVEASEIASAVLEYLTELSEGENVSEEDLDIVIEGVLEKSEKEEYENGETNESGLVSAVVNAVSEYISTSGSLEVDITDEALNALAEALSDGYSESLQLKFSAYLTSDPVVMQMTQALMGMINMDSLQSSMSQMMASYMSSYTDSIMGVMTEQMSAAMECMMTEMMSGMTQQLTEQTSAAMEDMMSEAMGEVMEKVMSEMMEEITNQLSAAMEDMMSGMMEEITDQISASLSDAMEDMMSGMVEEITDQMSETMSDAFSIDSDTLSEAFSFNMESADLTELLTSMSSSSGTSYDNNLNSLGYMDMANPSEIDIYPADFDSKEYVVAILDDYNDRMEEAGESDKTISYTDMVATMMSSVTTIINVVSYVLIAFIAVSLIVSSIMISIITQISVMERTKEIGILRAMGASKANISQVFNAETFIIGTCSGLIGVLVTELLIIPINVIIHALTGSSSVNAVLSANYAAVLVILSIAITVLSGLVPALKAARQDPVTALRSE